MRPGDQEGIISALCLHFTTLCVKAELDQLVDGLNCLGVLSFVRANPAVSRSLFTLGATPPLSGECVFDMFQARLSPTGSNAREREEAQLVHWANFLELVEGKCN